MVDLCSLEEVSLESLSVRWLTLLAQIIIIVGQIPRLEI